MFANPTRNARNGLPLYGLQAGKKGGGLRRLRRSGENRLFVGLEHAKADVEILYMIGARRIGDCEISAKEGRTEFGDEFLHGAGVIAKALAKLAVAARRHPGYAFPP